MRLILIAGFLVFSSGLAGTAQADEQGLYVNAGVESWDADVANVFARGGYMVTKNFGGEVETSFGVTKIQGARVDSSFAGYAVAKARVFKDLRVLARLGYHKTNISLENVGTGSVSSVAGGLGLEYPFSENMSIRLDGTAKYIDQAEDVWAIGSIAVVRKF